MNKETIQKYLGKLFVPRSNGLEGVCFRSEYLDKSGGENPVYRIVSDAMHDSGLSFEFSYEIASRAVDILAGQDDWEEISEAVDSSVPIYNNEIAEIYNANAWAVDDAINELGTGNDADSIQRAALGWYYAIDNMTRSIASKLEDIVDEDDAIDEDEDEDEDEREQDKEAKREDAMGYNKTLRDLLSSGDPAVLRLAKGIKKEFTK